MTYTLLPEARFPSGARDVLLAVDWLGRELSRFRGDKNDIVAVGHSAGGAHLAAALLAELPGSLELKVRGMILLSVPLHCDLSLPMRKMNMMLYHDAQTEAEVMSNTAVELLRRADPARVTGRKILLLVSQYDTDEIVRGYLRFTEAFWAKVRYLPNLEVLSGHNHVTTAFAVGLEDDVLGPRIMSFLEELD